MHARSVSLLVVCLAPVAAQALPADRTTGAAAVGEERLRTWLETLAGPEFEGRGTGQPGFAKAARFMAETLAEIGVEPRGDAGTFLQRVPWTRIEGDPERCRLIVRPAAGAGFELLPGAEFAGEVEFREQAAGPLLLWAPADLAAAADAVPAVAGAVVAVVVPDGDPVPDDRARQRLLRRLQAALSRQRGDAGGAAAVLFVDRRRAARTGGLIGASQPGPGAANPAVRAGQPNRIFVGAGLLQRLGIEALEGYRQPREVAAEAELRIELRSGPAPAFNVVGLLPGSDPRLAEECVVVGCHLDHLGISGGEVHPGADDDGSGSAGLLAVASMLAANPLPPRRSVLFLAFCGEERGLVGSDYLVKNPPVPLPAMVAELQMDMIGRHEESASEPAANNVNSLHLIGTEKLSRDLHSLCLDLNKRHAGFDLEWDEEDVFFRSDHMNFARRGIPVAFFFTGFHPDYHQPTDTPDKIDYAKLLRVATYVYAVAFELAQRDDRPLVDEDLWRKTREDRRIRAHGQPAAPVRRRG